MSRTRALITTAALAVGLATPLAATTTAAEAAPTQKVVRTVSYGDKAVTVPKNSKGVVRFRGRKGDLVTLDGVQPARARLFRSGKRLQSRWDGSGLFQLPRTGTYSFHVGIQRYRDQKVLLLKGRVHRLAVDGPAVRVPQARRGYIDLGATHVDTGQRLTLDTGRTNQRLYQAGGTYCSVPGGPLMLRTGYPVRVADDPESATCEDVRRGSHLVRLRSGYRATAASALVVPIQPDGAPVTLSARLKAQREVVLSFPAAVADYVYLEQSGASVLNSASRLDPWGRPVESLRTNLEPGEGGFVVAAGGPTELSTVTSEVGGAATATVRLRKGIRVTDLVPDGPALEIPLDGSGTRVYSLATGDGIRLTATSRDLDAAEAWTVEASPRAPYACGADPAGAQGCADNGFAAVSGTRSSATSFFVLRAPVAVAIPAVGTTGTVSLNLLTTP